MVIQSVMLSPCGGHKAVWDNEETPRSPIPWNPRPPTPRSPATWEPPTPDSQVANAREPPSQHETSDNEASSGDEDQWEDLLPAIDDTPLEQPSQKATARQLSVTKKTKVSGKKQPRDSKKKRELVNRGRQLARVHGKQTKLAFEQCMRDATPKRTRSDTGDSPGSTGMNGKHSRLTNTGEAGDTMQNSMSQPI